jgi:hypothetical protein
MSEPTYTLAEAQRELARRQCATTGHEWNILSAYPGGPPVRITCASCGWAGSIAMGERCSQ